RGVLFEEARNRGVSRERLDQLDLRAIKGTRRSRCIDKAHLHSLVRKVERLMYLRRAHHVAVKDNAVGDRRRRNADMVQAAQFHIALAIHPIVTAIPISTNNAPNKATKRLKLHARAKRNGLSSRRTMKLMPL